MKKVYQIAFVLASLLMVACQNAPRPGYVERPHIVQKRQELQQKLLKLLPEQQRSFASAQKEATWLADTAYKASAAIARHNKPMFVNWLNNRMVNTRKNVRHRGLCWHYQHDLYRELRRRPLHYFTLGCCVKDQGRGGEHHVVYVAPKNAPRTKVILLDAWWYAGRLRVEEEKDADGWMDDPRSAANLNRIYPAGHRRPIEHWSMVRTGTRYADYIYSDLPEARKTAQWKYMQEQIRQGMKRRRGKPYDY